LIVSSAWRAAYFNLLHGWLTAKDGGFLVTVAKVLDEKQLIIDLGKFFNQISVLDISAIDITIFICLFFYNAEKIMSINIC
jgi:hypothetical protein